jgi:hypothetical protein
MIYFSFRKLSRVRLETETNYNKFYALHLFKLIFNLFLLYR